MIDRILALGGFVATYAHSAPEFLSEGRANRAAPHGNTIVGYGFGTDVNGLGDQANPRPDAATNPLVYPFTAPNGTTVHKQTFGSRTFDLNTDGAAQYGLFADWTTDVIRQAGGDSTVLRQHLMSGAEAYVRMWEQSIAW
jgi:hypothetical protein